MSSPPVIVVGHDGSTLAPQVLAAAVSLAHELGARLLLFRAVGLFTHRPADTSGLRSEQVAELMREAALAGLHAAAATLPSELIAGYEARIDASWQGICDTARERGALLIVIGAHGHGVVDRLLGTTAAKVVNHAPCSVLVVRGDGLTEQVEQGHPGAAEPSGLHV
jgi:nucleotide-binding universal stress UspA family protein